MINSWGTSLLRQLAAEGVAGWLAEDAARPFGPATLSRLTAGGDFHGLVSTAVSVPALRAACDALLPVYDIGDGGSGLVSAAVDEATARAVERPNLLLRIAADRAGLGLISDVLSRGIGVDAGPVGSLERYDAVLDAYITGLDRALAAGRPLDRIPAVVSVPVGPIDVEVDARLDELPNDTEELDELRGAAALALARVAFRMREARLRESWWRVLRAAGARPPQFLWTAPQACQLTRLVGWHTGHAVTTDVLEASAAYGLPRGDTLLNAHPEGSRTLAALEDLGIDLRETRQRQSDDRT